MASRFRKVGVTAIGACAGAGLAAWALNPFDRKYAVSFHDCLMKDDFPL